MIIENKKFAILITTKNRLEDLTFTLEKINGLLLRDDVECIIYDDGSEDGTFEFLSKNSRNIQVFRNETSKGLIYCRNRMLEKATAEYAISIDDDLHFITENPLEIIDEYFNAHPKCSLMSFRIFWSKSEPACTKTAQRSEKIKCFAGGAHALRVSDWKKIPDYPEWFVFYGEENFAAYQMFLRNMEIHYVPQILTHHRVDNLQRKKGVDYSLRMRRSLRSGWYLYFLFLPLRVIPRKMLESVWVQLRYRVFKGDFETLKILLLAFFDLFVAFPKIIKNRNRLSYQQYNEYLELACTQLYWKPEEHVQS